MRIGRWGIAIVIAAASVASAQMSVPPAEYRPAIAHKAEPAPGLRLPQGGHVRRIALPLPTAAEGVAPKASAKAGTTSPLLRNKGHRLALGFARAVPPADRSMALADLPWRATASGTQAAQIVLTSPGAAAVRLGLALRDAPPGLAVRFQGSVSGAPAFGPFTGACDRRRSRLLVAGTGGRHRHHRIRVARRRGAARCAARIADDFPSQCDGPEPARLRRQHRIRRTVRGRYRVLEPDAATASSRRRPTRSHA